MSYHVVVNADRGPKRIWRATTVFLMVVSFVSLWAIVTGVASFFSSCALAWPFGGSALACAASPPPKPRPSNSPLDQRTLETQYEVLDARTGAASEESKGTFQLLTLLVTLSSLYALALGLNSYFSLKQILDNAEKDSKRATDQVEKAIEKSETQLQDFRDAIRSRYPELANLQRSLQDLIEQTSSALEPKEDWKKTIYPNLSPAKRQQVLIAEARLSGLEVFRLGDLQTYSRDVRDIYHALGRFYGSKYAAEGTRPDWHRARIYFDIALGIAREVKEASSAGVFSDAGSHFLQPVIGKVPLAAVSEPADPDLDDLPRLRDRAEALFRSSLQLDPLDARALYNLAWIENKKGDARKALELAKRLIAITAWRSGDREWFLGWALYNCACYRAKAFPENKEELRTALADLEKSKSEMRPEDIGQWKRSFASEPDLSALRSAFPAAAGALLS